MKILVAFDASPHSIRALSFACILARGAGVKTLDAVMLLPECIKVDDTRLSQVRLPPECSGIKINFVVERYSQITSSIANEIMRMITEGSYDVLILGAKGLSTREDVTIGSNALWLAAYAPITVVIVR